MAIIKPPRPPIACPMKRTRAVSAASSSKVFNRFPVISLFSSQTCSARGGGPTVRKGLITVPSLAVGLPPRRCALNKKDLLRIADHGAAKGLDLSALSGLADEPDHLSEAIVLTTHSDPRAQRG